MSSPFSYAAYRLSFIVFTASTARVLVLFVVDPPMYASTACVRASMPVVEVRLFGSPLVMTGSRSA